MRRVLQSLSLLGLLLTVLPAFLVFAGRIEWNTHANLMLIGMILWFGSAPFWMRREED
jgi:hypothetical protein